MHLPSGRSLLLAIAIVLSLVCVSILGKLPQPKLLESAADADSLGKIICGLGSRKHAALAFSLGFDFLFMAAYGTAIGLGCDSVAQLYTGWQSTLGRVVAFAQILGVAIDISENTSLILLLTGSFSAATMQVARLATASKFVLPVTGFAYAAIFGLLSLRRP